MPLNLANKKMIKMVGQEQNNSNFKILLALCVEFHSILILYDIKVQVNCINN